MTIATPILHRPRQIDADIESCIYLIMGFGQHQHLNIGCERQWSGTKLVFPLPKSTQIKMKTAATAAAGCNRIAEVHGFLSRP